MNDRASDGTAALDKALDVLDAVGSAARGLSQAELATRLALPRTTLYRLLATLVGRGLLRRDPQRRVYCLGMRCFEYARAAYAMPDLVAAAGIELRALRDLSGETSYLAVLDGLDVLSLERCDGPHNLRSQAAIGQRKPLHCTSQGKAILSALPPEARDALVRELTLSAATPRSITDRRRLQAELRLTASRGYSIDDEEIALGVRCCGAPIVDGQGQVRGAISIAGPAFRLTMARVELLGPEVAQAARRIGAQLDATQARSAQGPVRVLDGPWAFHGAFPRWSAARGELLWADTLGPALHAHDGSRDCVLAEFDAPIEALLLHADGAVVAQADGWSLVTAKRTRPLRLPKRRLRAPAVRNDGTLWACQSDGERWRIGAVGANGALTGGWHLNEDVSALGWNAAGDTAYAVAPGSGTLYELRVGNSTVRRLATMPKGSGTLGGVAVDRAGGVWTTLQDGWSAVRFAADGALDRVVALPVPAPTDLAFGGARLETLFVTTARANLSREALANAPLAGRLLAIESEFEGAACAEWRRELA